MTLERKIVALFLALGVSFSLGSFLVLKFTVFPAFQEFENDAIEAALMRVSQELRSDLQALKSVNLEYSMNDQTYSFAKGVQPELVAENFDYELRKNDNIDLILLFDRQGRQISGGIQIPNTSGSLSLEQEFVQPLDPAHPLVSRGSAADSLSGLVKTRSGIMQVTSYPVLSASGQGPVAGSLVVGQFLTPARIATIGARTMASISMHFSGQVRYEAGAGNESAPLQDGSAFGYKVLQDIYGDTVASLEVSTPQKITQIGSDVTRTVTLLLFALIITFLLAALLFMRQMIVVPLTQLTNQILGIRKTGNLHFEAGAIQSDEVGILAGEFEAMTRQLCSGQEKLELARDEALATTQAKSEFLARMSHEIRTPMNGVLGMTELLRNTQLESKQRRFIDSIYESAESLLKIINDILDFSKIEAGKLRIDHVDVNLRAIVEETVDSLAGMAHKQNVELMTMVPPELNTLVRSDPVRLRQILVNLVSNAIKFTNDGEVVVELTVSESGTGFRDVGFAVRDTGIGIREELQEEIFDSFTQADGSITRLYGGTGLGLTICKQLIGQMGGELKLQSRPNEGSQFSFTLRLQTSRAVVTASCTNMHYVAGRRVLIVDDNATNREILQRQLGSWRAHADTAISADDAYGKIVSAVASGAPFDLAILDMHMPCADGLDLARSIRANPALGKLRLVILSSLATALTEDVLSGLDIAAQLGKPVRQSKLYDALTMVMGDKKGIHQDSNYSALQVRRLSGRVLVVEDNVVNQAVAQSMLEDVGLTVELAVNGLDAVERFASGSFDLVLMDCQLPVMDGFKATELIREEEAKTGLAHTPIIAATANVQKKDLERCFVAGMNDCLTKPFTSEQLHAVLALYLHVPDMNLSDRAEGIHHRKSVDKGAKRPVPPLISVIDPATLNRLVKLQQPGAPNILRKLLSLYLQSSKVTKERLGNALDCSNAGIVRESAHALKSSSLNVGAIDLADLCKQLETMGRDNKLPEGQELKDLLEKEYTRVVSALQTELRGMST